MKLRALLWVIGLGALFVPVFPDPPLRTGAYLQNVTATTAVVALIESGRRPLVCEVRAASGARSVVARVTESARRRHTFAIDGLQAGNAYDYTITTEAGALVDAGSLRTPPTDDARPLRLLAVGDSGGQPWWVDLQNAPLLQIPMRAGWLPPSGNVAGIGAAMAAERPQAWMHVGDVVYPKGEHRYYATGFFMPFADLLRHAPCFAVLGNHDMDGDNGLPFLQNFVLPTNTVTGDERFFSVPWGPVRIVGLDLQGPMTAEHPALAFLERALPEVTEPWLIVITHYPFYSASRHGDRPDLQALLRPLLLRHHVDLMLNGHDHNYQRFGDPLDPRDDADALVQVTTGGGGKSLYELHEHPRLRASFGGYQYTVLDFEGLRLELRIKDAAGKVVDTYVLDKQRLIDDGKLVLDAGRPRDRRILALRRG